MKTKNKVNPIHYADGAVNEQIRMKQTCQIPISRPQILTAKIPFNHKPNTKSTIRLPYQSFLINKIPFAK